MEDARLCKINICIGLLVLFSQWSNCVPAIGRGDLEGHIRKSSDNQQVKSEARQGVISNWIQNFQFTPLGVNVPGIISNTTSGVQHVVGEGVQNASSNIGQGFQNFGHGIQAVGQTVGNGIKNFGQALGEGYQVVVNNVAQRFPLVGRLPVPGVNKPQVIQELPTIPHNQNNLSNQSDPEISSNLTEIKLQE